MSSAIIAFVGVIVGAIIAAGSDYLIAGRRERADTLRENRNRAIEIPVVGRVAAGAPLLAEENLDDTVQIDPSVLPQSGKDVFALKVKGDSMIGDGIFDGDLVFVRRQSTARSGEIVVALIDGEATVKRFFPEGGGRIRLQPSNPSMEPIYVTAAQAKEASIAGLVVGVFRKVTPRA